MAQPAPAIGGIAERIGGAGEVVTATTVPQMLNPTDIRRIIEWVRVARVHMPPVVGMTPIPVGTASDWQHEHT